LTALILAEERIVAFKAFDNEHQRLSLWATSRPGVVMSGWRPFGNVIVDDILA
jgi:hypothetical protein